MTIRAGIIILALSMAAGLAHTAPARAETADPYGVLATVDRYAAQYGVSAAYVECIVLCEDPSLDPWAVGARGEQGPLQLAPHGGIWDVTAYGRAGIEPFAVSMDEQIRVGIELIAHGHAREWSCS